MRDLVLWTALLIMGCRAPGQPGVDPVGDMAADAIPAAVECALGPADDFAGAEAAAEDNFACRHPDVPVRTTCRLLPGWRMPPDYGPDGVQGVWTIGRPVAECVGQAEAAYPETVRLDLPPVTLGPMRAPWGTGQFEAMACLNAMLGDSEAPIESAESWAATLAQRATCAPQVKTVVECWGPVLLNEEPYIACRLQFIELEAAFIKVYPTDR